MNTIGKITVTKSKTLFAILVYKSIIHPCTFLTFQSTKGRRSIHLTEQVPALKNNKNVPRIPLWKVAKPKPLR